MEGFDWLFWILITLLLAESWARAGAEVYRASREGGGDREAKSADSPV